MKRILSLSSVLIILLCLLPCFTVSAAGSITISADKTSVTVGDTVTITVTCDGGGASFTSIDAYLHYNNAAFEFKSCENADAIGSAGVMKLSYFAKEFEGPKSLDIILTFKAIAVGDGGFNWETEGMYDDDGNLLSNAGKTLTVTAINPTQSGNANLSSLKPSSGTLTPKFSPGTTEYTVKVPYTVTSLTISATPADKGAKVTAVSGSNSLKVGKNTREVTVTAANGTTKKYTVVITRSENQNTTTGGGTSTTEPAPPEDALEVTVGGETFLVSDSQPSAALPAGFAWSTATVNGVLVSAAKHELTETVLLYLTPAGSKDGNFYIYYENNGQFAPFRPFTVNGGQYILLDMPAGQAAPVGTLLSTLTYEGGSVSAFVYEAPAQADFSVVYAIAPNGNIGLYVYDRTDGSLQRYRETDTPADTLPQEDPPKEGLLAYLMAHKNVLLIVAAVCGGLALVAGVAILITVMSRRRHGRKH